jgi:phenylpropionate dioxygenase-like ring-hydroxylating dioxygenase large terminal subunit
VGKFEKTPNTPRAVTYGPEAFISPEFARLETERLWPKVWQHACRVEELANVGDYVTYDIVDDTILIVRSAPDTINAFYNVCMHRGRRLAEGCGKARQFVCKYHAWRYGLDGKLIHILDEGDWGGAISCESLRIPQVRVDTWGGWVWINMEPDCEPLSDYLETIPELADPYEMDRMRYRWRMRSIVDCNWKVALEAFSEAYHVTGTHPQLVKFADFYTWSTTAGRHSHKGFRERKPELNVSESNTYYRPGKGDDPRASIARLQVETWETTNATTTQTIVDAAKRLVDELPEGTPASEVTAHWMASAKRDDAARGVIWPAIPPEHMARVGNSIHIFPNLSIGLGMTSALCYRARPLGRDPDRCIFEAYALERFPEGMEPETEWIEADPFKEPEKWPPVLLQDFANMGEVHRGMKCRGFRGAHPNPLQEQPVINLHRGLAHYLGTEPPQPLD